ncbi:hypothetical protein SOVF_153320, partial [Spinacia oleracea]
MANNVLILSLFILTLQIHLLPGEATTLTIENNCNYTVWPVIRNRNTAARTNTNVTDGFFLLGGDSKVINVNSSWTGQLWGRTQCSTNSLTKNFSCLTGDCGTGNINCRDMPYIPPVTLIELTTSSETKQDFYDVSAVHGYNIPVAVSPQSGGSGSGGGYCTVIGCVFNYNDDCPEKLRVIKNQNIIGCRNPCDVLDTNECNGNSSSFIFKKACPRAYSDTLDDVAATFVCSNNKTSYTISFCPSPSIA